MHVKKPNSHSIAVRIDIFQLTQTGFSIVLLEQVPVHAWNVILSVMIKRLTRVVNMHLCIVRLVLMRSGRRKNKLCFWS